MVRKASLSMQRSTDIDDAGLSPVAARNEYAAHSDLELVRLLQADDLDAFEALFNRHRVFIYRTAYGLTGDRDVAEEVLQDTFVRAYRHRATLHTDRSPLPWLHRVALNLCYSRLVRKKLPVEPIADSAHALSDGSDEPHEWAERQEMNRSLGEGIASLPPGQQSVVVLRYLHGLSLQETSTLLGIRPGTVKSRLHYALHRLRDILARSDEGRAADGRVADADPAAAPTQAESSR
jgi:RNA polymerase sigma-70 factor (ECF subfamily)